MLKDGVHVSSRPRNLQTVFSSGHILGTSTHLSYKISSIYIWYNIYIYIYHLFSHKLMTV